MTETPLNGSRPTSRALTLADITDQRAYERERADFRAHVIALKRRRRVHLGPVVTMLFENRDTIRFQIQEMARAERMVTDQAIQTELDTYNPLIPDPGHLTATLFIELTSRAEMEQWLPRLVGIERAVEFRIGQGTVVRCQVDEAHAAQLTRQEVTAAVHYVNFALTPDEVAAFAREPVVLAIAHPSYQESTLLSEDTKASLLEDLAG